MSSFEEACSKLGLEDDQAKKITQRLHKSLENVSVCAVGVNRTTGDIICADRLSGASERTCLGHAGTSDMHAEMQLLKKLKAYMKDEKESEFDVFISTAPCGACSASFLEHMRSESSVFIRSITYFDSSFVSTSAFGKAVSAMPGIKVLHVSKSSIKMNFDSTGSLEPIRVERLSWYRKKHELTGLVPGLLDWSRKVKSEQRMLQKDFESKLVLEYAKRDRTDVFWSTSQMKNLLRGRDSVTLAISPEKDHVNKTISLLKLDWKDSESHVSRAKNDSRMIMCTLVKEKDVREFESSLLQHNQRLDMY